MPVAGLVRLRKHLFARQAHVRDQGPGGPRLSVLRHPDRSTSTWTDPEVDQGVPRPGHGAVPAAPPS